MLQRPDGGRELAVGAEFGEDAGGGQADVGIGELPALAGQEVVAAAGAGDCVLGGGDAAGDALRVDRGAEGRSEFDGCWLGRFGVSDCGL